MKGRNTITLNRATMIEAAQLWLNATFKAPVPTVDGVQYRPDNGGSFQIDLIEPAEDEEDDD